MAREDETTVFQHPHWPEVELPEDDFKRVLDLVDALDPTQLQRLYCKVALKVPTTETLEEPVQKDTLPPPPAIENALRWEPPQARPSSGYEDLRIDWDDEVEDTNPGIGT